MGEGMGRVRWESGGTRVDGGRGGVGGATPASIKQNKLDFILARDTVHL